MYNIHITYVLWSSRARVDSFDFTPMERDSGNLSVSSYIYISQVQGEGGRRGDQNSFPIEATIPINPDLA